jgi:hypothetical protein
MGVTIDPGLMERFLANQDPLTAEERKFLKKLAEEQDKSAPSELLTNVSTQQVKRSDFIPKQDDTAATQQNGEAAAEGQAEAPETSLPMSTPCSPGQRVHQALCPPGPEA